MEAPPEIVAELRRREPVFLVEPAEGGRDHIESLLVSDYFEIGASGRLYTRENVIDRALGRQERDEPQVEFVLEDLTVREICQNVYLASYTLHQPDGHITRTTRRSTVWTDSSGDWQIVHHQGTIAEPTPT